MHKPVPQPTAHTRPFWEACNQQKLQFQACKRCHTVQLIPRTVCTQCHAPDLEWKESDGKGVVLSHTTVYRAPTPAFKADVPYVIALIDMDEGFRLMTNVRGAPPSAVAIGQRVRIGFEARGETLLPVAHLEPQ